MDTKRMSRMHKAAYYYVTLFGLYVLPCAPGTKIPLTAHGALDASNDIEQVNKWWTEHPNANVAFNPGKSGHVIKDDDTYKPEYAGEGFLDRCDEETVTTLTPGGGTQTWYKCEVDEFGNSTGTLPAGVDVRCRNAYAMLPPSIHPNGGEYMFEAGYSIRDMDPIPLPGKVRWALLQGNQSKPLPVAFEDDVPAPDLPSGDWELVFDPPPKGQRSEADYQVILKLIGVGYSDDQIRAVFQHYPIGTNGKYATAGDRYLAHSIGKARSWLADNPDYTKKNDIPHQARKLREHIVRYGKHRNTHVINLAAHLYTLAAERRTWNPIQSIKVVRDHIGVGSTRTVHTAAAQLIRLGILKEWKPGDAMQAGQWILNPAYVPVAKCNPSNTITEVSNCELGLHYDPGSDYAEHMGDSAFLIGQSKTAKRKARAEKCKWGNVEKGLGAVFLRIATIVLHQPLTRQQICEQTGISHATVKRHTLRGEELGLLFVDQPGGNGTEKYYSLNLDDERWAAEPDIWVKVKALEPQLRTYKLREERQQRDLEEDIAHLTGVANNTGDEAIREEAQRRMQHKQRKLAEVFAALHEEWSEEECVKAAYSPRVAKQYTAKHHAILKAKEHKARKQAQADNQARRNLELGLLRSAWLQLRNQGVPQHEWWDKLRIAGWTPREIKTVLRKDVRYV